MKPFDLGELSARIHTVAERYGQRSEPHMTVGPLVVVPAERRISRDGELVELTARMGGARQPVEPAGIDRLQGSDRGRTLRVRRGNREQCRQVYATGCARNSAPAQSRRSGASATDGRFMTRKLMLWLTGSTLLFWIVASGLGAFVMRDEFDEVFDSSLQETAERLMPLIVDDLFQRDSADEARRVAGGSAEDEEFLTYQVRDAKGAVLLHSVQPEPFDAPLRQGFSDTATRNLYGGCSQQHDLPAGADNLDERREAMTEGLPSLCRSPARAAQHGQHLVFRRGAH